MRRFGYWRDPLCLVAATGYTLNRWAIKPYVAVPFLHGRFNDVLLIPAALPVVLWLQRRCGWRKDDFMPRWSEILMHLCVWAVICEWLGPRWGGHGTADGWDVVAYAAGGLVAGFWWHRTGPRPREWRHEF